MSGHSILYLGRGEFAADYLAELETLPGIGPVRGQTIIDYRTVNGPFHDIAAIMEVHGIGQATFDNIKELITTGN